MNKKTISVVAAVIRDGERVFATQRGYGEFKDGWEFPGGKIEPGETAEEALVREIREELDTEISVGKLIDRIEYDYPTFHLSMDCFWCEILSGDLVLKEAEDAKWLTKETLDSVDWLPADITLIEQIREELDMDTKKTETPRDIDSKIINVVNAMDFSDGFAVEEISERALNKAKKIPISNLALLGTAFSQMSEAARTTVTTVTSEIKMENLFVGIWPEGANGRLSINEIGATVGNIMGEKGIDSRMRFKPISEVFMENTITSIKPLDPTMVAIAVALMEINRKLDGIQSSIDEVLRFLETDKQAKQRGNLQTLAEIMEDFKRKGNDADFCKSRNHTVQEIQRDARQDIEFYKTRIETAVKEKKTFHSQKDVREYVDSITTNFAEYQLACYLYAYSTFLDTVLRKDFEEESIGSCRSKIIRIAEDYDALFRECRAQIASYQRSSVGNKVVGGIGKTAGTLGKAIRSIPVIEKGPVDELLLDAGGVLRDVNKDTVKAQVNNLEVLENNRMGDFLNGIGVVGALCNRKSAMITDGMNLYVFDSETV